jgi:hypothetical protein
MPNTLKMEKFNMQILEEKYQRISEKEGWFDLQLERIMEKINNKDKLLHIAAKAVGSNNF